MFLFSGAILSAFKSFPDSSRRLMIVLHCVFKSLLHFVSRLIDRKCTNVKNQISLRSLTPWLAPYPASICLYRRIAADGAFRRIIWDIPNDGWRPTQRRFLCPDLFVTKCTNRVPKRRKHDYTYLSMYLYYVHTWPGYVFLENTNYVFTWH